MHCGYDGIGTRPLERSGRSAGVEVYAMQASGMQATGKIMQYDSYIGLLELLTALH